MTPSAEPQHISISEIVAGHGEPPWAEALFTQSPPALTADPARTTATFPNAGLIRVNRRLRCLDGGARERCPEPDSKGP